MAGGGATVEAAGARYDLDPGDGRPFTFGRGAACTVCLDAGDVGISRLAGSVEWVEGLWFVKNRSTTRPLTIADPVGFRTVLAPGRRMAVDDRLSIVVEGQIRRHELVVTGPGATAPPQPGTGHDADDERDDEGTPTEIGASVTLNSEDRLALVALFAGYLEPFPRYDPRPRSYADVANRLGWPRSTLVKRVEYIRIRLIRAGVPNLQGEHALEALAEHALAAGLVGRHDLAQLP